MSSCRLSPVHQDACCCRDTPSISVLSRHTTRPAVVSHTGRGSTEANAAARGETRARSGGLEGV
eukprot:3438196-Pyramimonas_sp.AAC.1